MSKVAYAPAWAIALNAAQAAPRCGAKTRSGMACAAPAMPNKRCRMHGGASTGRRTPEGMERLRQAPLKHGQRGAEARQAARERGAARREMAALNALLCELEEALQGSALS